MIRKKLWWVLIIIWCAVIFVHSHMPASVSSKESMWFVKLLDTLAMGLFTGEGFDVVEHVLRKAGHFTEYFILGFLLFKGFVMGNRYRALAFSLLCGLLYAISDEIHQYFVPGRAMWISDVAIDFIGLLAGSLLAYWFAVRNRKRRETGVKGS